MLKTNRKVDKEAIAGLRLQDRVKLEAEITDNRVDEVDIDDLVKSIQRLYAYKKQQPWREYAFGWLGDLSGKMVLDVACGYSMTPVIMALAGARVCAIDVSPRSIDVVNEVAGRFGVEVETYVGPAEQLPWNANSFDCAFGGAAIHHLDLSVFGKELNRVLKNRGRAAFQDPLGENPILEFVRDRIPYPNKHPVKGTDKPLRIEQIEQFGSRFGRYEYRTFDALAMLGKALRLPVRSRLRQRLQQADDWMFEKIPATKKLARFVVTCIER